MAQKVSKGKGVASSSHGRTRSIMSQEAPNKDPSIQPQPPRRWAHVGHGQEDPPPREQFDILSVAQVDHNWALTMIRDVLKGKGEERGKIQFKGVSYWRFLRRNQINKEMVDYRPRYDPHRIDVKKTVWSYAVYW
ncbi:hypothetical protein HAX54_016317 [Datura stramonium]|uniref:Uncharacterized protein n=1 Tax=Datura stramonium TaxID=4076 RepID=A0ABS8UKX3_DATST|nr:hypothetical protein [Datura stramonium]